MEETTTTMNNHTGTGIPAEIDPWKKKEDGIYCQKLLKWKQKLEKLIEESTNEVEVECSKASLSMVEGALASLTTPTRKTLKFDTENDPFPDVKVPKEISLKFFGYLDLKSLSQALTISKQWHKDCNHPVTMPKKLLEQPPNHTIMIRLSENNERRNKQLLQNIRTAFDSVKFNCMEVHVFDTNAIRKALPSIETPGARRQLATFSNIQFSSV